MSIDYTDLRQHAYVLAARELCTTAELSAVALGCPLEKARDALHTMAADRYLRPGLLAGLGNRIVYQPTAKNLPTAGVVPAALRANAPAAARLRALVRGAVCFRHRPELSYLTAGEQAVLRRRYGIPDRGYGTALVGLDGSHFDIFVPLDGSSRAAIEAAAARWLPLLDAGVGTLHPVVRADHVEAANAALAAFAPNCGDETALRAQMDCLQAEIADDTTGMAGMRLGAKLRALASQVAAVVDGLPWLGQVVGVQL